MTKAERSRNLRYKKPALMELGYDFITDKLYEISDACGEVRWAAEGDNEVLLSALDDDEEDEFEFKTLFSLLEAECDQLRELLIENEYIRDYFDDCTVGLIGNRFRIMGFDDYEEDYFSLTSFEQELAQKESGKRLMRMTKANMLSTIGQCIGIVLSFQNVQMKYDYLKATLDILRDENTSILKTIKAIEEAYEDANEAGFYGYSESAKKYERLINELPDRFWIE